MFTFLAEIIQTQKPPNDELHERPQEQDTQDVPANIDELVSRAKAGDSDAFSEIASVFERFVYNAACRALYAAGAGASDAEDVAKDALIKAWRSIGSFRGDCSFTTWLFRITVNAAKDSVRRSSRRQTVPLTRQNDDGEDEIWDVPVTTGSEVPEYAVSRAETIRAVREAVSRLPEDQRQVIVMRDIHELPYSEIARILGLEEGTVKSRISRGRANLKKILKNTELL